MGHLWNIVFICSSSYFYLSPCCCCSFLLIKRNRLTSLWIKIAVIYGGKYGCFAWSFVGSSSLDRGCTFADGRVCFSSSLAFSLLGNGASWDFVPIRSCIASLRVTCSSNTNLFVFSCSSHNAAFALSQRHRGTGRQTEATKRHRHRRRIRCGLSNKLNLADPFENIYTNLPLSVCFVVVVPGPFLIS